jgi:4-hydroxybenzoate polyprenyltransferase
MKNAVLHLRIPFSFFLLPSFLLGCVAAGSIVSLSLSPRLLAIFAILHLLLYPASNAFNSFYDRDEGSIGGLEFPPPLSQGVLIVSWFLDSAAVIWAYFISLPFCLFVVLYGLISKMYSHPIARWKARPYLSFFCVVTLQGAGVAWATFAGLTGQAVPSTVLPMLAASLLVAAGYPISQIYQHAEDQKRGDQTLSRRLGVEGTFRFSALCALGYAAVMLFALAKSPLLAVAFALVMAIVVWRARRWQAQLQKKGNAPNYRSVHTQQMIGATLTNVFLALWIWSLC